MVFKKRKSEYSIHLELSSHRVHAQLDSAPTPQRLFPMHDEIVYAPFCNEQAPFQFVDIWRGATRVHEMCLLSVSFSTDLVWAAWTSRSVEPTLFVKCMYRVEHVKDPFASVPETARMEFEKKIPVGGLCAHTRWTVMCQPKRKSFQLHRKEPFFPITICEVEDHQLPLLQRELLLTSKERGVIFDVTDIQKEAGEDKSCVFFQIGEFENIFPVCVHFQQLGFWCFPTNDLHYRTLEILVDRMDRFKHSWVQDYHANPTRVGPRREQDNWPMQFLPSTMETTFNFEGLASQTTGRGAPEPLRSYIHNFELKVQLERQAALRVEVAAVQSKLVEHSYLAECCSKLCSASDCREEDLSSHTMLEEHMRGLRSTLVRLRADLEWLGASIVETKQTPRSRKMSKPQQVQALTCFFHMQSGSTCMEKCKLVLWCYYIHGHIVRYMNKYSNTGLKRGLGRKLRNFKTPHPVAQSRLNLMLQEDGALKCDGIHKGGRGFHRHRAMTVYAPQDSRRLPKKEYNRCDQFNPFANRIESRPSM